MTLGAVIHYFELFFLLYFFAINSGYLALDILSFFSIAKYMKSHSATLSIIQSGFEPPVSVLVPAYNEEVSISESVKSFLQLHYSEYEVVVINDGSTDGTLEALKRDFALREFPEAYRKRIGARPVKTIYQSYKHQNLRVVDKENGGKSDALNVGINCARYPLVCCVDADSIMQADSLKKVVQPFMEDSSTIASGGTVRVANGCKVKEGFLVEPGLPSNPLALFQIVEYLRAFLFGRLGWSPLNALLIISGAFGVFRKESVVEVGGYRTDTIGEDMDLIVRLHKKNRLAGRKYRITFVPDPICWTEAPEDMRTLKNQRVRWQRGLAESLTRNMGLMFHPRSGFVGWGAFPFFFFFEFLGCVIEVAAYLVTAVAWFYGLISPDTALAFLFVAVGLGVFISVTALLLEEMSFHLYGKVRHMVILFLVAIMENFGYRQLTTVFRLMGFLGWALGRKSKWGRMRRAGLEVKG